MSRRLAAGALLFAAAFAVLAALVVLAPPRVVEADLALSERTAQSTWSRGWVLRAAELATWLGSEWLLLPLCVLCAGILLLRRRWWVAIWLTVTVWGGVLVNTTLKHAVRGDRPDYPQVALEPTGWSFPSGHSQGAVVFWVAVILVVGGALVSRPRARAVAVGMVVMVAAVVGWSRVALGVHWWTDVLGGWLLGSAWVLASTAVLVWARGRSTVRPLAQA
jgi:undecaprenyl-diphosphatase